ncbi:hypothetical protein SNE40_021885 [Patella caerulea]
MIGRFSGFIWSVMVKYLKYIAGLLIIYLIVYSNILSQYLQTRLIPISLNSEDRKRPIDASAATYRPISGRNSSLEKSSIFKSNGNLEYGYSHSTDTSTRNYKQFPSGNSSSEKFRNLEYIQVSGRNSSVDKFSSCCRDASLIALDKIKNPVFDGEYLLNNKSICCGPTPITAIVVVHTAPHHFNRRQNVRDTYGSRLLFLPIEIRVIFLLGRVNSSEMQNKILRENTQYSDIIQGNFIDAYHNLSLKAVMGLHWVSHFCCKVKYVIKTDDDAIFDMWRFLTLINAKNLYVSKTIYGISKSKGIIFRSGKWGIDKNLFKDQTFYPFQYCIGFVLIYSSDAIPALYRASYVVPFLWLDDVYVTGMLRTAANGIEIVNGGGNLSLTVSSHVGLKCLQDRGDECPYLAVGSTENTFHAMWELIKKRHHK